MVGYGNDIERECHTQACQKLGIPILRRSSGGRHRAAGADCLNYSLFADRRRGENRKYWHDQLPCDDDQPGRAWPCRAKLLRSRDTQIWPLMVSNSPATPSDGGATPAFPRHHFAVSTFVDRPSAPHVHPANQTTVRAAVTNVLPEHSINTKL